MTLATCRVEGKLPGTCSLFLSIVLTWLRYRATLGDWGKKEVIVNHRCSFWSWAIICYGRCANPEVFIKMEMKLFLIGPQTTLHHISTSITLFPKKGRIEWSPLPLSSSPSLFLPAFFPTSPMPLPSSLSLCVPFSHSLLPLPLPSIDPLCWDKLHLTNTGSQGTLLRRCWLM